MMNWLKKQRGALFSMDARIALVVGSILAGTIGVQVVQKIQRDRVELAGAQALSIMKALDNYLSDEPSTLASAVVYGHPSTFSTGTNNYASIVLDGGYASEPIATTDPWGNEWVYEGCATNLSIEGVTVSVYYAAVYSRGPDGIADSGTNDFLVNATCAADYGAWEVANDDIGMKYTNLELQRTRVAEYRRRAQTVLAALQTYENTRFLDNQRFCSNSGNQANARCNWDTSASSPGYDLGEEARMNYYPRSSLDTLDSGTSPNDFYYDMNGGGFGGGVSGHWTFGSTPVGMNFNSELLINEIGLSQEYVTDPWGRRLCYHSNSGGVLEAPFLATVSYASSCP